MFRRADPNEWRNLTANPKDAKKHAAVIAEHRRWLPAHSAPPAVGSRSRILIYKDGKANWEGKEIAPGEAIPEL